MQGLRSALLDKLRQVCIYYCPINQQPIQDKGHTLSSKARLEPLTTWSPCHKKSLLVFLGQWLFAVSSLIRIERQNCLFAIIDLMVTGGYERGLDCWDAFPIGFSGCLKGMSLSLKFFQTAIWWTSDVISPIGLASLKRSVIHDSPVFLFLEIS